MRGFSPIESPIVSIQWFPGHMHATRQAIRDRLKAGVDVVIELLDARCPGASSNPLLARMTQGKAALKLLNKQDLADPARTALWIEHFNALKGTRALALNSHQGAPVKALVAACRELSPFRGSLVKPLRVMVCGIPNVGKSTLINALLGKRAAKTGDEPGVTKTEQRLQLASGVYLWDTPGMLWPKIEVPESGLLLAACGAVGRNAFEEELVALELLELLQTAYPQALVQRYGIDDPALDADGRLDAIGRRRGAVMSGGRINRQKASEILLTDFRQGQLGRITLETPEQHAAWVAAAALAAEPPADEKDGEDEA